MPARPHCLEHPELSKESDMRVHGELFRHHVTDPEIRKRIVHRFLATEPERLRREMVAREREESIRADFRARHRYLDELEDREAILYGGIAIHVQLNNIRVEISDFSPRIPHITATIVELPTPGFEAIPSHLVPGNRRWIGEHEGSLQWDVMGKPPAPNALMWSTNMGDLYFSESLVRKVVELAAEWTDEFDQAARYDRVGGFLNEENPRRLARVDWDFLEAIGIRSRMERYSFRQDDEVEDLDLDSEDDYFKQDPLDPAYTEWQFRLSYELLDGPVGTVSYLVDGHRKLVKTDDTPDIGRAFGRYSLKYLECYVPDRRIECDQDRALLMPEFVRHIPWGGRIVGVQWNSETPGLGHQIARLMSAAPRIAAPIVDENDWISRKRIPLTISMGKGGGGRYLNQTGDRNGPAQVGTGSPPSPTHC